MPNLRYTAASTGITLPVVSSSNGVEKAPTEREALVCGGAYLNVLEACRTHSMFVITQSYFDSTVIFLILANCVFLALDDPTAEVRCIVYCTRSLGGLSRSVQSATICTNCG